MNASEQLKQLVEEIIKKLGVTATVDVVADEGHFRIKLESEDSALLIGRAGETLDALQLIVRLLAHQLQLGEARIGLDINGYKSQKEDDFVQFIAGVAARVKESQLPETLRPMTSYERRLVHQTISEVSGLVSESTGEGPERRVTIRPA